MECARLSDQAKQMGQITGAASATNEYATSLKDASREGEHPERQLRESEREPWSV